MTSRELPQDPHPDPLPASGERECGGRFRLPARRHIPGTGTEPDRAPLEAAKALVRHPVIAAEWEANEPYRYGAALCLNGFFWEAHEVWEAVWMACSPNGRERRLLRALIQIANAALKLKMGRINAASRLLAEAEELLRECEMGTAPGVLMGVELAAQRRAAAVLQAVKTARPEDVGGLFVPLQSVARAGLQRNLHYNADYHLETAL